LYSTTNFQTTKIRPTSTQFQTTPNALVFSKNQPALPL
jgi:hypothetical protein